MPLYDSQLGKRDKEASWNCRLSQARSLSHPNSELAEEILENNHKVYLVSFIRSCSHLEVVRNGVIQNKFVDRVQFHKFHVTVTERDLPNLSYSS